MYRRRHLYIYICIYFPNIFLQIEENTKALSTLQHASVQEGSMALEGTSPAAKKPRSMALERFRMGAKKAMLMWAQKAVTEYVFP